VIPPTPRSGIKHRQTVKLHMACLQTPCRSPPIHGCSLVTDMHGRVPGWTCSAARSFAKGSEEDRPWDGRPDTSRICVFGSCAFDGTIPPPEALARGLQTTSTTSPMWAESTLVDSAALVVDCCTRRTSEGVDCVPWLWPRVPGGWECREFAAVAFQKDVWSVVGLASTTKIENDIIARTGFGIPNEEYVAQMTSVVGRGEVTGPLRLVTNIFCSDTGIRSIRGPVETGLLEEKWTEQCGRQEERIIRGHKEDSRWRLFHQGVMCAWGDVLDLDDMPQWMSRDRNKTKKTAE